MTANRKALAWPLAGERGEAFLAGKIVPRVDVADGAGARAHHHRMRRRAAREAAHAAQHRAVCDPGCGKHHVGVREVEQAVFSVEIGDAETMRAAALVVVTE